MAHQPAERLFSLFGFVIWGDFADLTMYRSQRGKVVVFPKTYPGSPGSPLQQAQRNRLKAAAADWVALTEDQRSQWDLASRRASLCSTGYNLYLHWKLTGDDSAIQTLERQTRTTLLPP